jgi:hypothetical protein
MIAPWKSIRVKSGLKHRDPIQGKLWVCMLILTILISPTQRQPRYIKMIRLIHNLISHKQHYVSFKIFCIGYSIHSPFGLSI